MTNKTNKLINKLSIKKQTNLQIIKKKQINK